MVIRIRRFPRLRPGDRVRLVSPASRPEPELVRQYLAVLADWGLDAEVADHAFDRRGYLAGSDQDRLRDIDEAFRDPGIRAVITTRGGAGAYRIADHLDFTVARADPKPLVGFSDITYLHLSLLANAGIGGIHGCLVGGTARSSLQRLLLDAGPVTVRSDPDAVSAEIGVAGVARGPLIGGNLASVATSVGVRLPSLAGAILFLEDQRLVGLGTVDRQLTQLIASGSLDGLAGVALGSFEGFRGYGDRGWTLTDVLADRLGQLGVPVLGGLFAGHDLSGPDGTPDQQCLPLGSPATLDATAGTLTIEPIVE